MLVRLTSVTQLPPHQVLLARAAAAFESCWRLDVLDALAVAAAGGALRVFTFLPFSAGHCNDMRPRLVAEWSVRGPRHPAAMGLVAKVRDLGGCTLRVTVTQTRPWVDVVPDNASSGRYTLRGTYAYVHW